MYIITKMTLSRLEGRCTNKRVVLSDVREKKKKSWQVQIYKVLTVIDENGICLALEIGHVSPRWLEASELATGYICLQARQYSAADLGHRILDRSHESACASQ